MTNTLGESPERSRSPSSDTEIDRAKNCYVCAAAVEPYARIDCRTYLKCVSCGNYQLETIESQAELDAFYDEYHMPGSAGGAYASVDPRMQADFPDKVRLIQRQCGDPTKLRLLDVGCGKGYFVAEAAKAGFQSAGIDISSSGVAFARNQLNVVAHCADICDNTLPAGGFDVATCWATIEHLPYPLDTLKAIFRVLRPGGWLFLDTGLADSDLFERKLIGTSQWFDPDER